MSQLVLAILILAIVIGMFWIVLCPLKKEKVKDIASQKKSLKSSINLKSYLNYYLGKKNYTWTSNDVTVENINLVFVECDRAILITLLTNLKNVVGSQRSKVRFEIVGKKFVSLEVEAGADKIDQLERQHFIIDSGLRVSKDGEKLTYIFKRTSINNSFLFSLVIAESGRIFKFGTNNILDSAMQKISKSREGQRETPIRSSDFRGLLKMIAPGDLIFVDYNSLKFLDLDFSDKSLFDNLSRHCIMFSEWSEEVEVFCNKNCVKLVTEFDLDQINIVLDEKHVSVSDVILIDDSEAVHLKWREDSRKHNFEYAGFENPVDFRDRVHFFRSNTPIFLDSSLGSGIKGEDVSMSLFASGFEKIYLNSHFSVQEQDRKPWLNYLGSKKSFIDIENEKNNCSRSVV